MYPTNKLRYHRYDAVCSLITNYIRNVLNMFDKSVDQNQTWQFGQ